MPPARPWPPPPAASHPTRMVVGERQTVELLWSLIGPSFPAPRGPAPPVRLRRRPRPAGPRPCPGPGPRPPRRTVRRGPGAPAVRRHVHRGDGREPDGYDPTTATRRRVRMLISRGWTYVYEAAGQLQFKMDVGCASNLTAQIQGVYVPRPPRPRRRHSPPCPPAATSRFDRHPNLSLYVNDFNTPAVAPLRAHRVPARALRLPDDHAALAAGRRRKLSTTLPCAAQGAVTAP